LAAPARAATVNVGVTADGQLPAPPLHRHRRRESPRVPRS